MIDNIFSGNIELFEKFNREFTFTNFNTHEDYKQTHTYYILDTEGSYALLYHEQSKHFPFIVVFRLDKQSGIWEQGHYFSSLRQAIIYFNEVSL